MGKDMRSRMSLFVAGLGFSSSKEGRGTILIMDISRLMVYVNQVEEKNIKDREEYQNKKAETEMSLANKNVVLADHNSKMQRGMLHHLPVHLHSERKASIVVVTRRTPMLKCPNLKGQYMREYPNNKKGGENPGNKAQFSSVSPPNRVAPSGVASCTGGGENRLYAITSL
ncbi:uncharacterized protein [Solanum lycopersicum]|uniref:uncharacterized protein n=1 Tax=Solanum lycopersicum TaxID=4081 RepID=UPI000532CE98|nr:uncharacterized protein LOC104645169 [Solanum lycopersicum]